MVATVLLFQIDQKVETTLSAVLTKLGYQVWRAGSNTEMIRLLDEKMPELALIDLHLPEKMAIRICEVIKKQFPKTSVILNSAFPDFELELRTRERGAKAILRPPYTVDSISQVLKQVNESNAKNASPTIRKSSGYRASHALPTVPTSEFFSGIAASSTDATVDENQKTPQRKKTSVRVPMRFKITLPFIILALIIALGAGYLISRFVNESLEGRFYNQLASTGIQAADWMVREEQRLLETLRLINSTRGMADLVLANQPEALRLAILPLAINGKIDVVHVLDLNGIAVVSLYHDQVSPPEIYTATTGDVIYAELDFVQMILRGMIDEQGGKNAGLARLPIGDYFYTASALRQADGRLAGVVLVGSPLDALGKRMKSELMAEVTFFSMGGERLYSTLFTNPETATLEPELVQSLLLQVEDYAKMRELPGDSLNYGEILGAWQVRNGKHIGVLGIAMAQVYQTQTSTLTRLQAMLLVAIAFLLVILVGITLSNQITAPLLKVVRASEEVTQGNLDIKVSTQGNDEIAVLASSFNTMIQGLQEGSIYRDLLGRTVSPEVRETLRNTFASGNVNLEGQEAIASVLMTDIRSFTNLSEQADPAEVFKWLNEYFGELVPVITENGGVVNKFDGDALLAFFGILPRLTSPEQSAYCACKAAVGMLKAINRLNRIRQSRNQPPFITGIGVNTGVLIAGGLGSIDRVHYTIIGDTVNTTQRIETLTRQFYTESGIIISRATFMALGEARNEFLIEPLGLQSVKGKTEQILVYSLSSLRREPDLSLLNPVQEF